MNKHAAEKIAFEYYNLGIQLALQNAGLLKTAEKPRVTRAKNEAFDTAQKGKMNAVPYKGNPKIKDIAEKYDMPMDKVRAAAKRGQRAADMAVNLDNAMMGRGGIGPEGGVPYRY
mgnify:CR=1 FL=1